MITKEQLKLFTKKFNSNESTIYREYLQTLFLKKLYKHKQSNKVFFKGGTAIHFLLDGSRFSEDLDFTVMMNESKFALFINLIFEEFSKEEKVTFKQRHTITGKRYLLTATTDILPYATFINLDFSFREKVLQPEKSIFETEYPIIFTSFIFHLSPEELCAEKIRAILTRQKGRDYYDLWFLLQKGILIDDQLIKEKLAYYKITNKQLKNLLIKVQKYREKDYVTDMKPFVPFKERDKLKDQFNYIKAYLARKLILNI